MHARSCTEMKSLAHEVKSALQRQLCKATKNVKRPIYSAQGAMPTRICMIPLLKSLDQCYLARFSQRSSCIQVSIFCAPRHVLLHCTHRFDTRPSLSYIATSRFANSGVWRSARSGPMLRCVYSQLRI